MKDRGSNIERLRNDPSMIAECLERLDSSGLDEGRADVRRSPRFQFRPPELIVELQTEGHTWRRYAIPARNISAGGISFLLGHFVYPGTPCRVHLVSLLAQRVCRTGRVTRVRYLEGTANLHEVGVRFDAPIDVAMFHRGAVTTQVLLADDDRCMQSVIPSLLRNHMVQITSALDGTRALELADRTEFDLTLLDAELPQVNGIDVAKRLRANGYATPIVAILTSAAQPDEATLLEAGFDSWIVRPVSRDSLHELLRAIRNEPIVSSLAEEHALAELIDAFVASLPVRVRQIQSLLAAKDHARAAELLRALESDSVTTGFEPLGDAARRLHESVLAPAPPRVLRSQMSALAHACRAVRPVVGTLLTSQAPA